MSQLISGVRQTGLYQSARRHRRANRRNKCERRYRLDAPQGVRGRNTDNTLIREIYGWAPSVSLIEGLTVDLRVGL